jgi:SAM-dependent MidA family methyltransferase
VRCTPQIVLDTHSFQAPCFYKRLGFKIIDTHSGYLRGHQKYYLQAIDLVIKWRLFDDLASVIMFH